MKLSEHTIGDGARYVDIFQFIESRIIQGKYHTTDLEWENIFILLAQLAIDPSPEKTKELLNLLIKAKAWTKYSEGKINEFGKSFQTLEEVLKKLDTQVQKLTEPKSEGKT